MKYDAVIEPTPEGWSGWVVGLAAYGVGATVADVTEDLREAAALYAEAMAEHNQPIPPPQPYQGPPLEPGGRILPKAIQVEAPALTG